jgi:hypothetical protein
MSTADVGTRSKKDLHEPDKCHGKGEELRLKTSEELANLAFKK